MPVRVGFIGVSGDPASWATGTHAPHLLSSPDFEITAIVNRSIASGKAAIAANNLPADTKIYTSSSDLAADPNVDLVVISTNVSTHYDVALPVLKAQSKKDLFIEWPLGANIEQAEELAALSKEKGVKTIIGLQGHMNPIVDKLREIIDSGEIGKVLVTTMSTYAGMGEGAMPARYSYITDHKSGGSMTSIPLIHNFDHALQVLGEVKSFASLLSVQKPEVTFTEGESTKTYQRTSADHIFVHGFLENDVLFQVSLFEGSAVTPEDSLKWVIVGTKGKIEVSSTSPWLSMLAAPFIIKVKGSDGEIRTIEVPTEGPKGNVARLYDGYVKADKRVPDFELALKRHRFLEELYAGKLGERVIEASRH